jgi:HD-GYP domain-containing protein (c-di-GMP phosphodiesterase class II)
MDSSLLQFILQTQKVDYALFDPSLRLTDWSNGLKAYLPAGGELAPGMMVADLFPELSGYEDILLEIQEGRHNPLAIDRIEKFGSHHSYRFVIEQLPEYYSLQAFPYNGSLLVIIRNVSEEGSLEQRVIHRRNELDLLNIHLIGDLKNANGELYQAYVTTLEGWATALEMRDVDTKGHSQRVMDLTIFLSGLIGVDKEDQIYYGYGALLHDIGKMGIPDKILFKNSSLDEKEWDIMRQHPVYAYNLLSPIKYLSRALDIPHYHHEKWDGSGYPMGLRGNNIPLPARIFTVVDVYDALTSKRPYRKEWTKEEALRFIQEKSGIYFDPQVVDSFISHI